MLQSEFLNWEDRRPTHRGGWWPQILLAPAQDVSTRYLDCPETPRRKPAEVEYFQCFCLDLYYYLLWLVLSQMWHSDGYAVLVYKNSSWHGSLKFVGSHSKDSVLCHWAKLASPLWKCVSLPRLNLAPKSACVLSLSSVHSPSHVFSHIQMRAHGRIPWLTCLPAHVPASGAHAFTPRCRNDLWAKAVPALNQMLIFPFLPVKLPSCQAPLSEAAPGAKSSSSERQQLRGGWGRCSANNTCWLCPKSGIPRRWMRGNIMPTVDLVSRAAHRFLGRIALVCRSSHLGSGPDLGSLWPWRPGCLWTHIPTWLWSVTLLWVTPHRALLLSTHTMRLPGLTLSFSRLHVIYQIICRITDICDSWTGQQTMKITQAHKLSNVMIF